MEETSRRIAAESEVVGITAERDVYRQESEVLKLKLSMQHELNSSHCQMEQDQGCRGCARPPQPMGPSSHDMPHGSDAAEVNTGQACTINHLGNSSSMSSSIAHSRFRTPGSVMVT